MIERNYLYETSQKQVERSEAGVAKEFSASDCVESLAERFHYRDISINTDGSALTIPRPEVFAFTPEENRILPMKYIIFLLEYYAKKNYKIAKNSPKQRFEIWKDNEV